MDTFAAYIKNDYLMLHGHGNHIIEINKRIQADFSSNIWYKPLNKGLTEYLQQVLFKISDYPTVDAFNLQCKVSNHYGIVDNEVCITSGATEAFYLISHAFKQKTSTILYPSFSEYADAAKMYDHQIKFVSNDQVYENSLFDTDLVWIGNPNNPDGKLLSIELIENLLKKNTQSIFVIDEAYGELCLGFESAVNLISKYSNLIVVKSVTKLCSIPGLRLGYIIAKEELVNKIGVFRMPWSVSTLALEAGMFIFSRYDEFILNVKELTQECYLFQFELSKLDRLEVKPSSTNYFLVKMKDKSASELKEYLINKYSFLIRDCSNFYGLNNSYFRLAIQGYKKNSDCVKAISNFLNS